MPSDLNTPLSPALLSRPIQGRHLHAETLGQELGSGVTLMVFLRHLG